MKFAEDFKKYGDENPDANTPLSRVAHHFGTSYKSVEDGRETLLGVLSEQVHLLEHFLFNYIVSFFNKASGFDLVRFVSQFVQ